MATTAQWVFDKAIALMDELNEATGAADTTDTKEYKNRTLAILNLLQVECYPLSDTYRPVAGKRAVCAEITDFTAPIDLDDGLCRGALPYGLAAHLFLDENDAAASFFQQRYEEARDGLGRGFPHDFEEIGNPYGGVELGQFGTWGG